MALLDAGEALPGLPVLIGGLRQAHLSISGQPHGVAPTLNKAMGQALIRTGFAQDRFRRNDGLGLPAINK